VAELQDMLDFIKKILEERQETTNTFKRNLIKEYFQVLILSFLYSHKKYQDLVFYGGSCLRHCFNLPRVSEDLDFVDIKGKTNFENLGSDLKKYFEKNLGLKIGLKIQKFRIYLKFPILYKLDLAKRSESEFLFLKIEIFHRFGFCKKYRIEILPLFKFGESVLIRTFDLSTLMATKIRAILYRKWERTNKKGEILAKVKGRDYYDLMWYLEKGIEPNLKCIEGVKSKIELKERLLEIVKKVDTRSVKYDLEGLIEDTNFIEDLGNNIKRILDRQLKQF